MTESDGFSTLCCKVPAGIAAIMGLQFENLVLNNRKPLFQKLGIALSEIINENPFFQQKTKKQPGCQINYMVQTKFNTLYLCEIKFSKEKISSKVLQEVQTKMDHVSTKSRFSIRPVLIHVNGVAESVAESGFFSSIIDFSEFLVGE